MSEKSEGPGERAIRHSDEAKQILEESTKIQKLNDQGIIEEDEAAEKVMSLNERAIEETEKGIDRRSGKQIRTTIIAKSSSTYKAVMCY